MLILWGAVIEHGFSGQRWLTFRQALGLGGHVRKGERGTTVVYADRFTPDDERRRAAEAGEEPGAIPFLKRLPFPNRIKGRGSAVWRMFVGGRYVRKGDKVPRQALTDVLKDTTMLDVYRKRDLSLSIPAILMSSHRS